MMASSLPSNLLSAAGADTVAVAIATVSTAVSFFMRFPLASRRLEGVGRIRRIGRISPPHGQLALSSWTFRETSFAWPPRAQARTDSMFRSLL